MSYGGVQGEGKPMGAGRKLVIAVLGSLAIAVSVRADMMPVASLDIARSASVQADKPLDLQQNNHLDPSLTSLNVYALDLAPPECLPLDEMDVEPVADASESCPILTDGVDSFSLCLSTLVGLGLCASVRWVNKPSLGFIPDWYHHGGPYQIGSSHVVGPDCLCAAVVCFVQPGGLPSELSEQYHRGTIAPLLRKSQFTPTILGGRGPPSMS